ncbi:MAG: hypothetical protein U0V64_01570 [Cyclobacteriaceae bacterium]
MDLEEKVKIPLFPLSIFPLPGELVPLHIFEPRYRQLLEDAEARDISFGIYFKHPINEGNFGSMVKLESVIKRFPGGESDIIVRCTDLFVLGRLFRTYRDKLYPGGEVGFLNIDLTESVTERLHREFVLYRSMLNINQHAPELSVFHIANELNLDFEERVKFVVMTQQQKEHFLLSRIQFQKHILLEAEKSRDIFHLN